MVRAREALDRIEAEFDIQIEMQTLRVWVRAEKVKGRKVGGRWYVDWDSLVAFVQNDGDSGAGTP